MTVLRRFFIAVLIVSMFGVCVAAKAKKTEFSYLVSPVLLKEADLSLQWQTGLPIKKGESVDRIFVFDEYVYVLSTDNYLMCIDREKARMRFGLYLAPRGLPVSKPKYYGGRLWFTIGSELVIVEPFSGVIAEKKKIGSTGCASVCNIDRNQTHLFTAGSNRRISAINLDGYWNEFQVSADDDSSIISLVAEEDVIYFATEAGHITALSSKSPERLWQFEILGKIEAPILKDGQSIYVSSLNADIYKLYAVTGQMQWTLPFKAGAPLKQSGLAGREVLYQYAEAMGMYAINKDSGKMVWHLESGKGIMTETGSKAYVFAEPGVLIIMDNTTGKDICTVNFAEVTDYSTNLKDTDIYISDEAGRLAAIGTK